jgi:hypothetical protein
MKTQPNFINSRAHTIGVRAELVQTAAVYAMLLSVCVAMPLLLKFVPNNFFAANEQWIMGTVANTALVLVGVNFAGAGRVGAAVMLPSVAHIINFYAFGIGTVYSLYLVPAIWAGNLTLVLLIKYLHSYKGQSFALSAAVAISVKIAVVFALYGLLCLSGLIPAAPASALLPRMSLNQIYVAVIGCVLAYGILKAFYSKSVSQKA